MIVILKLWVLRMVFIDVVVMFLFKEEMMLLVMKMYLVVMGFFLDWMFWLEMKKKGCGVVFRWWLGGF